MTVSKLACNQEVTGPGHKVSYHMLSYGLQMCQKLNVVTFGQRGLFLFVSFSLVAKLS